MDNRTFHHDSKLENLLLDTLLKQNFNKMIAGRLNLADENKKELFYGCLAKAAQQLNIHSENQMVNPPLFVGQQHDNMNDLKKAKRYLESIDTKSAHEKVLVLFEANGNVHPSSPAEFVNLAKRRNLHYVCEHQLYSEFSSEKNGFVTYGRPEVSEKERSAIVGLFIALSLITNPQQKIAIIFGNNHYADISYHANNFLELLDHPKIEIEYSSSYSQEKLSNNLPDVEYLEMAVANYSNNLDNLPQVIVANDNPVDDLATLRMAANINGLVSRHFNKDVLPDKTRDIIFTACKNKKINPESIKLFLKTVDKNDLPKLDDNLAEFIKGHLPENIVLPQSSTTLLFSKLNIDPQKVTYAKDAANLNVSDAEKTINTTSEEEENSEEMGALFDFSDEHEANNFKI